MSLKRFKECRTCGKQAPRKWTESADVFWICDDCNQRSVQDVLSGKARMERMIETMANRPQAKVVQAPRSMADKSAAREANALRSDPTRRALRNQGDDLDPLNPLSLTSPLNPICHTSDRADWDSSSHRSHSSSHDDSSSRHHSSHDDGGSYDSGSSDSGSSSSGGCD
ncbi:hypothetical protein HOV35_gp50 [Escherichia phage Sortsne]|uniref:Uncharacterized protein n=1 Tax=Escherichia phage Sortsne TaxID=2562456 RepID=A0A4D6DZD2_9CAUD|nr:hypothetical protein HOV35_gp50 [Escherichia phage Sortsne]QBZ71615.1 hypothetical protein [Escherichia phage Sortsne]